jgi:serine/threonine protein phosphatase 1
VLNLLRRLRGGGRAVDPPAPERPVYAIGDIHGRVDLLIPLMERVLADAGTLDARPEVVLLGDYVDRGEGVADTLEFLMAMAGWPEIDLIPLLGNHEQMLLDFLDAPESASGWLSCGGLQTLASYGVQAAGAMRGPSELERIRDELGDAMGPHLEFIQSTRLFHLNGNVFFVHAAADPARPPAAQTPDVLLWGHEEFPRRQRTDGLWVVHGHVMVEEPVARGGVISIDTGAYVTHRLTAARLTPGEVRFLVA